MALVENAADVEKQEPWWVKDNRNGLKALGMDVQQVDLRKFVGYQKKLKAELGTCDVIWLGGGNTFYLRWILRESGADTIITEMVKAGKPYGGGSAGAVVAGPTLKHFEAADDPGDSPEVILEGLGLTDLVVVPHWDADHETMKKIDDTLKADGHKTKPLTDAQALVIDGDEQFIIP